MNTKLAKIKRKTNEMVKAKQRKGAKSFQNGNYIVAKQTLILVLLTLLMCFYLVNVQLLLFHHHWYWPILVIFFRIYINYTASKTGLILTFNIDFQRQVYLYMYIKNLCVSVISVNVVYQP